MSLNLVAASGQYAVKNSFSPPTARPVAMGCMFKPTAGASQGLLCMGVAGDLNNRMVIRDRAGPGVQHTDLAAGNLADYASSNLSNLNAWNWTNGAFLTAASRSVFLNGTKTTNATNVTSYPVFNEMVVGALDAGGISNSFDGRIAHVWMANAWSDAWDALLRSGIDPRQFMGTALLHYWPLATNYTDVVGGITLTGVAAPTFVASDQPTLTRGVSPWALGYPAGRPLGVRLYDSPRYRTRRRR